MKKLEKELLDLLNKTIRVCKPIHYGDFNLLISEKKKGELEKIESKDDRLGIRFKKENDKNSGTCISTASLLATITDVLIGKRLALELDDNGYITGFIWYKK